MPPAEQICWLFLLSLPIGCLAWLLDGRRSTVLAVANAFMQRDGPVRLCRVRAGAEAGYAC
jgi:hypothetical protein